MRRKLGLLFSIGLSALCIISCNQNSAKKDVEQTTNTKEGYPIEAVDIRNVKVTDSFWLPVIKRVQEKTIAYAIEKCRQEGRFDNFLIAGGKMEGEVKGAMPFDDSDVYKIIEGASNSLISSPDAKLERLLDSLISIVKTGQEPDGYLTTWRTINPAKPPATWVEVREGKRWESLAMSHELYNAGHMYEAAAVHYKATGKRNFLDIALKNADLMVRTFGDGEGKISAVPGHQIIETGLIKLYEITGKKEYLNLAKYFLDHRGDPTNHSLYGAYSQDSIPVIDQEEVMGHAVRAVYMYAGMTDIAALMDDEEYRNAVDKLWQNMVDKKMYITGGIGAKHDGEAFGKNYELPNLTAYNETCAAIGDVYWNNRLFNLTGDVKYYDVLERTLYNGLISGISLSGTEFFYPNALESDASYQFNQGAATRKEWFDCSCCPTNLIRFIPAIPGLIYAKEKNTLFVNLYMSSEAEVTLAKNKLKVKQETAYPWNGNIGLTVTPETEGEFILKLRIPGWARNEVIPGDLYNYKGMLKIQLPKVTVNGKSVNVKADDDYVTIDRVWKKGDKVMLQLPMEVREVIANELVTADVGKVALEYGPIVYAVEEADNKADFKEVAINSDSRFSVQYEPALLKGVQTITFTSGGHTFKAIPYYAWSNRGVNQMKVWIPLK